MKKNLNTKPFVVKNLKTKKIKKLFNLKIMQVKGKCGQKLENQKQSKNYETPKKWNWAEPELGKI